jgi:hypothetical protein
MFRLPILARRISAGVLAFVIAQPAFPALVVLPSTPLDVTHGKPFVMVMVNGKGPFRFVVDTGTGGEAIITSELADQLSLPVTGQSWLSDPSGQGRRRVPTVLIQSLQVAGVEFTRIKALKHTLTTSDGSCQGLLGFTLFRNYLLTLDYPRRQMTLTSGELAPDGEHSVLPFRMPRGIPIVTLHIGELRFEAQLDSGGGGLSLPEQLVQRLKFTSTPEVFANAHSLSTRFQIKAAKLASDISLGEYTFRRPFVEINAAFPLANFGSCPMQSFALTFDQKNNLVRFQSSHATLRLAATPMAIELQNAPVEWPPDPTLVPVG